MVFMPVIISGGAGSRLWPLSRDACPKPFVEMPDGGTLIGRAYSRAARLEGVGRIVTVTRRDLLVMASDAYRAATPPAVASTFLLEPVGRDTAAAVALAALYAAGAGGGETVLLVSPADHLIRDEDAFAGAVRRAVELARHKRIVTFGIAPDRPETGFGYIEVEGETARRFVEKPDAATAAAYVAGGRHRWNSGMFCFRADAMLRAMEAHCPAVLAGAREGLAAAAARTFRRHEIVEVAPEPMRRTPAISIDRAVMEKAGDVACVSVDCGWSDLGSWPALFDLVAPDETGNRTTGDVILEGTQDSCVRAGGRLVGLVGVSNLLVVDTPDAVLIAVKDKAQEVRRVYDRLKAADHEAARCHRTAHRPWGTYTVLEEGDRFKIKRLEVKPGGCLSLQAHRHRSEHWVVVCGTARVTNEGEVTLLRANQSTYIASGRRHRLENPGALPLIVIEVQSGDYLGEDDIVRFDDAYGRS